MSLAKKCKMAFAAIITAGMMFTGAEPVRAAPGTATSHAIGSVQDLLSNDVQEVRNGHRGGYRSGGMRSGRMGYRGARGFGGRAHYRGYRGYYGGRNHWRGRHHRHWRGGYWGGVGIYGGGYCVRRIGWHYNAWGEYVYGPYRRCY